MHEFKLSIFNIFTCKVFQIGCVVKWYHVRFACERPRVQFPAHPFLLFLSSSRFWIEINGSLLLENKSRSLSGDFTNFDVYKQQAIAIVDFGNHLLCIIQFRVEIFYFLPVYNCHFNINLFNFTLLIKSNKLLMMVKVK